MPDRNKRPIASHTRPWRALVHRRAALNLFAGISVLSGIGLCADCAIAQQDLLPDIPDSDVVVHLELITDGLASDVEGVPQYLPSDLSPSFDGTDRLFVMTLGGLVRVIDGSGRLLEAPYLDVRTADTDLTSPNLYGMVAVTMHPEFGNPTSPGYGRFYTIETEFSTAGIPDFDGSLEQVGGGGPHHDVVYEYTTPAPELNVFSGTRRALMRVEQPGWNHNLMDLAFGLDGYLYITSGDGSNMPPGKTLMRMNAQAPSNVFGTVLRIDPFGSNSANGAYGIPADNPNIGEPDALHEVYAYGLRSPWRLTVDRVDGTMLVGDVGQLQIEEVSRLMPAANYGWPFKEGSFQFDAMNFENTQPDTDDDRNGVGDLAELHELTDPLFQFDHQSGRAVAGGCIYRGDTIPDLFGQYVFSDATPTMGGVCMGDPSAGGTLNGIGAIARIARDPRGAQWPDRVISIGEDADGEMYLMGLDGSDGVLMRLHFACIPSLQCPEDIDCSMQVDVSDLLALLSAWGTNGPGAAIAEPLNVVDVQDLLLMLSSWGSCQ